MKKLTLLMSISIMLIASVAIAYPVSEFLQVPVEPVAISLIVGGAFIPKMQGVSFMAVSLNELTVAELVKQFDNVKDDFLATIRDHSDKVNNNIINFNDIGADPTVLIDNTTYPIASAGRTDSSVPVSLKKLDTENTIITRDELFALPYDKKSSVMDRHKIALKKASIYLGIHSLAAASDAANTPVMETTGTAVDGRKPLIIADLIKYKGKIDALNIEPENRFLILCPEHVNDLLAVDQVFRDKYHNTESGKVLNMYGFKMFENNYNTVYNGSNVKKAYGAAAAPLTDRNASTFFNNLTAMKAMGSVEMFMSDAATDPTMRQTVVGFRMHYIVEKMKNYGFGAIVSHRA